MTTTLIIGANRGIGFELTKQLVEMDHQVIATTRGNTGELDQLDAQIITDVDVSSDDSVATVKSALNARKVDWLIHVSGVLTNESFTDLDFDRIRRQFEVNTLGPLRMIHGLFDHITDGGKVGILTSRMGSVADNGSGGRYGYRISKTAANMVGMNLAHELEAKSTALALLHPGLVATEMTNGNGIPANESAKGLIQIMKKLTLEKTGKFWHAEGYELPW